MPATLARLLLVTWAVINSCTPHHQLRKTIPLDPVNEEFYQRDMAASQDGTFCSCPQNTFVSAVPHVSEYDTNCMMRKHVFFPNPDDCTKFYQYLPTNGGLYLYTFTCRCGLLFNKLSGCCEDPCSFPIGGILGSPQCAVPKGRNCKATLIAPKEGDCIQGSLNCRCNAATGQLYCRKGYVALNGRCKRVAKSWCECGWIRFKGSCYLINEKQRTTWEKSRSYCQSLNADLVKITSEEENTFLREKITESTWIGLNDRTTEGTFLWTDGSKPKYTKWADGEPNNAVVENEDCGIMWKERKYKWNDDVCSTKYGVICEKPVTVGSYAQG